MGQSSSCSNQEIPFDINKYVDEPEITVEDVYQIKNCFDYLHPVRGYVCIQAIAGLRQRAPSYMKELVQTLEKVKHDLDFDEFYNIMKPKVIELKQLPDDSIILEQNQTSVSCLICPFRSDKKYKVVKEQYN